MVADEFALVDIIMTQTYIYNYLIFSSPREVGGRFFQLLALAVCRLNMF